MCSVIERVGPPRTLWFWPRVVFCRWLKRDAIWQLKDTGEFICGELGVIDMEWLRMWFDAGCDDGNGCRQ